MKNKFQLAMTLAVILAIVLTSLALADDVANNADTSVDTTYETISLVTGGASRQIDLYTVNQNGDGKQGCNLTGQTTLVLKVTSSDTGVATVTPAQITFTACEAVNTNSNTAVTVAPVSTGSANIEFSLVSNNSDGSFNLDTARFTVVVATPANTPPVVAVTGVTGGANYEFGSVPAAGCSVTDAEDGPKTVSPVVGAVTGPLASFGLGSQEVTCSYTDTGGLTTTASATYSINDTHAPVLTVPADFSIEATSASGALVSFSATATDAVDPNPTVNCAPASGSSFAFGPTTVSCTASDVVGNTSAVKIFKVTVQDTTAPVIAAHGDEIAEATSAAGAFLNYTAPATSDAVDGADTATCAPVSGSTFALGDTTVTCNATDVHGNAAAPTTFKVTVKDTTPPAIALHGDETAEATSAAGAVVSYTTPATSDAVDGTGTATCAPASGSTFTLGDTTVTCNATDTHGNTATSTTFKVTVVDTTPPVITFLSRTAANGNGWNNSDVTVNWNCTDLVGVKASSVSQTVSTQGANQSATGTCEDTSGNKASDTQNGINIDKTKPSASASRTPDVNSFGWNNSDVTVSFSGTDALSGINFCSTSQTFGEGADQSASGTCTDKAGNVSDAATVDHINVDKTAPTISGAPDRAANANDWYNDDVIITFTCADNLSSVDTCTAPITLGEGVNQSADGNVTDKAGNSANTTVSGINIDKTAPSISAALDKLPDLSGWFNTSTGAPTVNFTCSDALSGLDGACPASHLFSDGENQSYSKSVSDLAGNSASAGVSNVDVDTVAPSISVTLDRSADASGWFNILTGAPIAKFTCSDDTSVIVSCPSDFTFGEGENQSHSSTVYDNAGNFASASVSDVDVDLTAPAVSAALDKSPAASGWFNISTGVPTVKFTCSDGTSGIASCPTDFTFGQGADQSHNGTAYDNAGNSASTGVSDVDVDTVAPSVSVALDRSVAASGWFNEVTGAPVAKFTCSDATSGIVTCPADYTFGNGENQSHLGTVFDNAGNSSSASVTNVDVDLVDPTIAWTGGLANGGNYDFGYVPAAPTCTANDAISGPNGCTVTGYSIAVGSHTMTATAYDMAGNMYSENRSYNVEGWVLKGFYQPVDMNGVYNVVKNGSTVPLKFEIFTKLSGVEITDVNAVKSLTYAQTACNTTASTDEIETVATGGTVLRYDTTGGQFIFNWKTPSTAGKCYRVTMTTDDGGSLVAFFKLK